MAWKDESILLGVCHEKVATGYNNINDNKKKKIRICFPTKFADPQKISIRLIDFLYPIGTTKLIIIYGPVVFGDTMMRRKQSAVWAEETSPATMVIE